MNSVLENGCPGCAYHDVDHELRYAIEKHLVERGLCDWSARGKPHPTEYAYRTLKYILNVGQVDNSIPPTEGSPNA